MKHWPSTAGVNYALPEEQKGPWDAVEEVVDARHKLLTAIKKLKHGEWPRYADELNGFIREAITVPWQRSEQLYEAAVAKREQEILATPIDDEAWEEELAQRVQEERIDALPDSEWIVRAGRT